MTCLFAMQGSLRWLSGEELETARRKIKDVMAQIGPVSVTGDVPAKRKLLLKLAQKHLEGTGRILNFLIDVHLLN